MELGPRGRQPPRAKPVTQRRRLAILAVPMVTFAVTANIGNALAPSLITDAPVTLLLLAPRLRWLLLVSPKVGALSFYAIPLLRAAAVLVTYFLLGRWYGDRAIRWLEDRAANTARPLLWIERQFHRARYPVAFLMPGNLVALLAGASPMPMPVYLGVALTSVAIRLVLVRYVADLFRGPLLDALDWIADYQLWLTVASIVGVFAWVAWSNRHGTAPVVAVDVLAEELDEAAEQLGDERPG